MEAAVVDAGSKLLKAGPTIPDQSPSIIIPTQMKRVLEEGSVNESSLSEDITVDPVVRGYIRDWDAMEDLLHHVLYTGLGWEIGNEGQILFTDPLSIPKAAREQLVQLMFETFNISGFYASEQAVLSLYAVGRISGCTADIGHGKIDIAPVIEGAVHHIASRRFEIGAQELGKSNPFSATYSLFCAGFEEGFQKEAGLCSSAIRPALVKPPEYMPENLTMYSAWVGGAILAKVVFPQNQHVTKADYDENGPSVVHRKCF
ncbi:hypothetical protein L484_020680 [Morus notabilis]|uniref:Actin-related protein 7 n=1 Tax=Morus notabilis TaxID=981085 RepID=W9QUB1_9ROSA|nr:hypothetical protein L484_020680 [Morus notabilis]